MNKENPSKLWKIIHETGDLLTILGQFFSLFIVI